MTAHIAELSERVHIADLPEQLRAGQEKAIPALIDHFGENDRGILQMCCGSGKTVTGAIYAELRAEPLTVVFTPYIHLVKQWRDDYLKWCGTTKAKFMCVCSENDPAYEMDPLTEAGLFKAIRNTSAEEFAQLVADAEKSRVEKHGETQISTDPEEIAAFLKQKGRKVVFVCYPSSEVYGDAQRLAGVHANFGIFDEAQRTAAGVKDTASTYALHDVNVQIDQRLFTTATVVHYTRDDMAYSMDNEHVYGKHVLVDKNGNPDPWTIRQAIDHHEAPPYRIVFSFVTDPAFDPKLVQLPPYQSLVQDIGDKADPGEVLRLTGQAVALERIKEKYGVKKPLGFFSNVATSQLYTDILNAAKNYPEYFPHLSQTDTAVSVSGYDPINERRIKVKHLHNSAETEINNSKLFLFGTSEDSIDAVNFADPMTSDTNVIQASGRAMRYVPGKIATIIVPVMLPYHGDDLASYVAQVDKEHIRDAFRKTIDILDSLAEADPILRRQMLSGSGNGGSYDRPGIIEFDFPKGFIPEARRAIAVESWRVINPESDFIDNLERDAAALNKYRLEKYPVQSDPAEEARAIENRAKIRIMPAEQNGYEAVGRRMSHLRLGIRAYYGAGEREDRYLSYIINENRIEQIYRTYSWDKKFVLQDDFEESLKQDAAALTKYRLEKYPTRDNPEEEAKAVESRSQIKIVPSKQKGYEATGQRMVGLRRAIKAYYEAGEKGARYGSQKITPKRVEQVLAIYGWDKNFILQDDYEERLKQDAVALTKYRLEKHPKCDDAAAEVKAAELRSQIRIIPQGQEDYETSAIRMGYLRNTVKAYYNAGEKEGRYGSRFLSAKRVEQILQIYGWDKKFVMQDDFEESLRQDVVALHQYRLQQIRTGNISIEEAAAIQARAEIKIIPEGQEDYEVAGRRMAKLRRNIRAYYEAGEKEGKYGVPGAQYVIDAKRVEQVCRIYRWDKNFIMQDEFEEGLKQDASALARYRLEQFPSQSNPETEAMAVGDRAGIVIVPGNQRMGALRRTLKDYFDAGEKEGTYGQYVITAKRVEQIFGAYGWDKDFIINSRERREVLRSNFEENLMRDAAALEKYRLEKYPTQVDQEKEAEATKLRADIRILPQNRHNPSSLRMADLRRAIKAYYESGKKDGKYGEYIAVTAHRVGQVFEAYGWDKDFVLQDDFQATLKQDAAVLAQYRLQQFPKQNEPIEEEKAAEARAQIKTIPQNRGHNKTAVRMGTLRQAIKAYYEAGEKEGSYKKFVLTADRVQQVCQIYGWDKSFIVQDDFEELLKQDAAALAKHRLERYPTQDNAQEEAKAVDLRADIKIISEGRDEATRRMSNLRRGIKAYYEAGEKEGTYSAYTINADRVQQIYRIYGWDKAFVMQDDFVALLKQDAKLLEKYRLDRYPTQDDSQEEAKAAAMRAQIRTIPQGQGFDPTAYRMGNLRLDIRAYYEAGEKEGRYRHYTINASRVQQVFEIYGWDRDFVIADPRGHIRKYRTLEETNHSDTALEAPSEPQTKSRHSKRADLSSKPKP